MNESFFIYGGIGLILLVPMTFYLLGIRRRERKAREAAEQGKLYSEGPRAQHPHVDTNRCIGCQGCTMICPEGDVLSMLGGKAVIINPHKCIGHGMCADACPVGAIQMVMANPSMGADLPFLTPEYETSVPGLFIAGELGGLALIKNAVNQGRECIETIAERLRSSAEPPPRETYDVIIVGAGPGGISASLAAIEHGLNYLTLERDEVGGTVAKYPRQKLVMTSPVEFPMYGKFKKTELSKENLLEFWQKVMQRADFRIQSGAKVEDVRRSDNGVLTVFTDRATYRARTVVLALGRTGTPRKLGVPGEDLPKVMYRLIEAGHYINKKILVVGGGDSAVEAAMGLGRQMGNQVTLSYRRESFSRLKERNTRRIEQAMQKGSIEVVFNSNPLEFKPESVVLEVGGARREIPNDFVWIFAGGVPPNDFLKKIGVSFGVQDVTAEAGREARNQAQGRAQLVRS